MRHILLLSVLFILTSCDSTTNHADTCGDQIVDVGEECDGADINGHSCTEFGYYEGIPSCNSDCSLNLTPCAAGGLCGDGVVHSAFAEECDGQNLDQQTCSDIDPSFYAGQGSLACGADCKFDTSGCLFCGDGQVTGEETCDGTDTGGQTCSDIDPLYHPQEGSLACVDCQIDLSACIFCGDNITNGPEVCDGTHLTTQPTCGEMGFAGGTPTCSAGCDAVDYSSCHTWVDIASFDKHSCALNSVGEVWCWGEGGSGRLGNGSSVDSPVPVRVQNLPGPATVITVGKEHSCAIVGGDVFCWGRNTSGQLGDGTTTNAPTPIQVDDSISIYNGITAGDSFTCAKVEGGTMKCWGDNTYGQLGSCSVQPYLASPELVPLSCGSPVPLRFNTRLSAGNDHICVDNTGNTYCWGRNLYGQLGNDSTLNADLHETSLYNDNGTLRVLNGSQIASGGYHACAANTDRSDAVVCWGRNTAGQLGSGSSTQQHVGFQTDPVLQGVSEVFAGLEHTCVFLDTGDIYCWGGNHNGELGQVPGDMYVTNPQVATTLSGAVKLALGAYTTCMLTSEGQIYCVGDNSVGQLGDGTTTDSSTPTLVTLP
ncbi:hypothetical protein KKF84_03695 [Myxococcota bacterium]|nr:hypothetical protein [Myxococcota bacterium]